MVELNSEVGDVLLHVLDVLLGSDGLAERDAQSVRAGAGDRLVDAGLLQPIDIGERLEDYGRPLVVLRIARVKAAVDLFEPFEHAVELSTNFAARFRFVALDLG